MKYLITILHFLIFAGIISGQSIEFYAEAGPRHLEMGGTFNYTITSTVKGKIKLPDLNGFTVVSGPMTSSFTQSSNFGGSSSTKTTYSWTYELMPQKPGNLTIREATMTYNGKSYRTNTITITVMEGNNSYIQQDKNLEPIFITYSADKNEIYLGESFVLSYDFYNRYEKASLQEHNLPAQKNAWVKEISPTSLAGWDTREEKVKTTWFVVSPMKKDVLVPNISGTYTPDPFEVTIATADSRFGRNVFKLKSKPFSIKVKPLPDGQPENFNGLVGNFKVSVKFSKTTVPANEAIELTISIKGTGNLQYLEKIPLKFPDSFEVFDPETRDNLSVDINGISGTKQYKILIIPRKEGIYETGDINLSWFSPTEKEYKTFTHPSTKIQVTKGEYVTQNPGDTSGRELTLHPLKPVDEKLHFKNDLVPSPLLYSMMMISPLLFLGSFVFVKRKKKVIDSNYKMIHARKIAVKQLEIAKKFMDDGDIKGFYAEVYKALNNYISSRFGIEAASLTKASANEKLAEKGVDEEIRIKLLHTLEECEMARFGNISSGHEQRIYDDAADLIGKIEMQAS